MSWLQLLVGLLNSDKYRIELILDRVYGERVCAMCYEVFKGDSDVCPRCELTLTPDVVVDYEDNY